MMSNWPCVDNMSVAKVSLVFRSDALIPEEVTIILGINPTWAHAKGEEAPKTKTPRSSGVWALEIEGQEVEAVASELLELLKTRREAISIVKKRFDACVAIGVWWEPDGGQGGYSLPAHLVVELASLASRVDFYFV